MSLFDVSVTSDRDYLEIYTDGTDTVSTVGGGDADAYPLALESGSITITHNLGVVPLVRCSGDVLKNGRWEDTNQDETSFIFITSVSTTTTTKIIVNNVSVGALSDIPVYYRIYNLGTEAVTSDFRVDKIFEKVPSFGNSIAGGSSIAPTTSTLTIPHGQGEVVNWTLQFSEDGSSWYNGGQRIKGPPDTDSGPPGGPYARFFYTTAYGSCDNTNFYVVVRNAYTTAKTIYIRYVLDYRV